MNKSDLVKKVAEANDITQKQAASVIDGFLNAVVDSVAEGESVALSGFGTFTAKHREARQARNPATGKLINISESTVPVFKPAKAFKVKVNQ